MHALPICVSLLSSFAWRFAAASTIPTEGNFVEDYLDWETGLQVPHHFLEVNLDDFENNSTQELKLEKRTDVTVCGGATLRNFASQTMDETIIEDVSSGIANQLYDNSQAKDCGFYSGTSHNFNWYLYAVAVASSNSPCDTTAELKTINGALQKYFRKRTETGGYVTGVSCIQLSHGEYPPNRVLVCIMVSGSR